MKNSPLIYGCTLFASLSLMNSGLALSASDVQPISKTLVNVKAKAVTPRARVATATKSRTAINSPSLKIASLDLQKRVTSVTPVAEPINPYFENQPAWILPKSAREYLANHALTTAANSTPEAAAPAVTASVVSAPAASVPAASVPAASVPVMSAPIALALATTILDTAPSNAAPAMAIPSAVAAVKTPTFSMPVVAYQASYIAPISTNPYYASQPLLNPQDAAKLFSDFSTGLQTSLTSQPQFGNSDQVSIPSTPRTGNARTENANAANPVSQFFSSLTLANLKMMVPLTGDSTIFPTIKKVYPTGEKPLVVINFKCPTEIIGITPPPMKLLHEGLNLGFEVLNKTNLLSFNIQQVCS